MKKPKINLNFKIAKIIFENILVSTFCICLLIGVGSGGYYFGYLKASHDVGQRIEAEMKELGDPLLKRMTETEKKVNDFGLQVMKNKSELEKHNDFMVERFNIWQWEE